jgi:uncharacterized membrane protein HdeD (DUF308 family)
MAATKTWDEGMEEIHPRRGWMFALGVALVVLGLLATAAVFVTTLATVLFLGCLLMIGGGFEIANALHHRQESFWMHLLTGILDVVVGAMLFAYPGAGAVALTMLLAMFFLVGGAFRFAAALTLKLPTRGWSMFSGIIDVCLGFLLLASWPVSAIWFIGFCVGVGLLVRGISWLARAFSFGEQGYQSPSRA